MGATSAQGWYLFTFIVGFTLLPAGLFALGWVVAVAGGGLLVVAVVGFRSIKESAASGRAGAARNPAQAPLEARAAKGF